MKIIFLSIITSIIFCPILRAQGSTIAERLGYAANAKLLIIHADDLGVSHSENSASIKGLEETPVNSGSIMVPCPWFPEIAKYARQNSSMDFGLHLTLNSEWINYKWGPVTVVDSVRSLTTDNGFFYNTIQDVVEKAKPQEVSLELRNQIKKAYAYGIDVTHLDPHMGTAIRSLDLLTAYIKLGKEFELPVLIDKRMSLLKNEKIIKLLDENTVLTDMIYTAEPEDYESGMVEYYTKVLNNLDPGLNSLLIHLAYDDAEMKAVTAEHDSWHSPWRQADMDFFSSAECERLIQENNIVLVTWRELRDKIVRVK